MISSIKTLVETGLDVRFEERKAFVLKSTANKSQRNITQTYPVDKVIKLDFIEGLFYFVGYGLSISLVILVIEKIVRTIATL